MAEYKTKVLIIGSGPAGYTAGIYAARAGMRPVLVSGLQKGGQLTITTDVENFPGFPEPINGGELMQRMHDQAVNVGVEIVDDQISEVDFSARPFVLISEGANSYRAESVIIATGASARWLGLENEEKFRGFGVCGGRRQGFRLPAGGDGRRFRLSGLSRSAAFFAGRMIIAGAEPGSCLWFRRRLPLRVPDGCCWGRNSRSCRLHGNRIFPQSFR